jgi:hypothetical protein
MQLAHPFNLRETNGGLDHLYDARTIPISFVERRPVTVFERSGLRLPPLRSTISAESGPDVTKIHLV